MTSPPRFDPVALAQAFFDEVTATGSVYHFEKSDDLDRGVGSFRDSGAAERPLSAAELVNRVSEWLRVRGVTVTEQQVRDVTDCFIRCVQRADSPQ
jgi:hypothetical protein